MDFESDFMNQVSTGANSWQFQFNGSPLMQINSNGNIGIGTTSPVTVGSYQTLTLNGPSGAGAYMSFGVNGTQQGAVYANSSGLSLETTTANPMTFWANGSERMRISSGGDVCINATATSGSAKLYVNGLAVFGSAQVGSLGTGTVYSSSGTLTNTNPSDKRLKENIISITYGLNEILKLNPVSFDWKNDNNKNKQFGFIAQEVQEVMPEAVIEGEYLGLEKDAIYTALVNAIKELEARLKTLENK
jgi:hypothetical protein